MEPRRHPRLRQETEQVVVRQTVPTPRRRGAVRLCLPMGRGHRRGDGFVRRE